MTAPDHIEELVNLEMSREQRRILEKMAGWLVNLTVAGLSEDEALTCLAGVRADLLNTEHDAVAA